MNTNKSKRVVILAYEQLCTFEFGCAVELFSLTTPEQNHWYSTQVVSIEAEPITASGGIRIQACTDRSLIDQCDILIIPGWSKHQQKPPGWLLDSLIKVHQKGGRLISFCSGAFLIAETGLLDGKQATTHWGYAEKFNQRFPDVEFMENVLYTEQDNIYCSAGSAAGLDLSLHIIKQDYGAGIANQRARRLVVPTHREGGQSQFVERKLDYKPSQLSRVMDWALENLDQDLKVETLASKANLSRRSFDRHFRSLIGLGAKQWIHLQRINLAREYLETSDAGIELIAEQSGFVNAMNLRHHFRKNLGISPAQYRNQFAR